MPLLQRGQLRMPRDDECPEVRRVLPGSDEPPATSPLQQSVRKKAQSAVIGPLHLAPSMHLSCKAALPAGGHAPQHHCLVCAPPSLLQEVRTLMLACLSEKPSARPNALQVLQSLRAVVEGGPPPGRNNNTAGSATGGPQEAPAAGPGEAAAAATLPDARPLRVSPAMSIQLRPPPPSPFAS